jgi:hypothetical protein
MCNHVIELKLITLINFIVHNYIITQYYSFGLGFWSNVIYFNFYFEI